MGTERSAGDGGGGQPIPCRAERGRRRRLRSSLLLSSNKRNLKRSRRTEHFKERQKRRSKTIRSGKRRTATKFTTTSQPGGGTSMRPLGESRLRSVLPFRIPFDPGSIRVQTFVEPDTWHRNVRGRSTDVRQWAWTRRAPFTWRRKGGGAGSRRREGAGSAETIRRNAKGCLVHSIQGTTWT